MARALARSQKEVHLRRVPTIDLFAGAGVWGAKTQFRL
jgi:hypothetical protein